jgi:hypothetical protein
MKEGLPFWSDQMNITPQIERAVGINTDGIGCRYRLGLIPFCEGIV